MEGLGSCGHGESFVGLGRVLLDVVLIWVVGLPRSGTSSDQRRRPRGTCMVLHILSNPRQTHTLDQDRTRIRVCDTNLHSPYPLLRRTPNTHAHCISYSLHCIYSRSLHHHRQIYHTLIIAVLIVTITLVSYLLLPRRIVGYVLCPHGPPPSPSPLPPVLVRPCIRCPHPDRLTANAIHRTHPLSPTSRSLVSPGNIRIRRIVCSVRNPL